MKYRVILKCDQTYLFDFLTKDLKDSYAKNKKSKDTPISKGLTFQTEVILNKKTKKYATIQVLEYDRPHLFVMDYRSNDYHKISSLELNKIEEDKTELIYELLEERLVNGKVEKSSGSYKSTEIKNAGLKTKLQYMDIASMLRKKKIEDLKNQES